MNTKWQRTQLINVCEFIKRGIAPKYIDDGGIRVLNQKCVRDHSINFDLSKRHNISLKSVNPERYVKVGDVLVNSTGTGTLGRVAQIREIPVETTTVDTHVTIVRPKQELFFDAFFGYMLIKIENEITKSGEGVCGQTELARKTLEEKFYVSYPESIPEQKRIVSILDKSFAGINQAIANTEKNLANARELFESSLNKVFTEKGEGWEDHYLSEILDFQPRNGWSPPAKNHSDQGTQVLSLSSVTGFNFNLEKRKYTSASTNKKSHYWVENGDLLITRSNTPELVGHVAICSGIDEPTIYPDLIMKLKLNNKIVKTKFAYYQLRSTRLRTIITSSAQGANPTMKKINKGIVQNLPISYPSLELQESIVTKLDSLLIQTQHLEQILMKKISSIKELKQSILQKAFSGEL